MESDNNNNNSNRFIVAAAPKDERSDGENSTIGQTTSGGAARDDRYEELWALLVAERAKADQLKEEIYYNSYEDMVGRFGGLPDMPRIDDKLHPHEHKGYAKFTVDALFVTDANLNFTFSPTEHATGYKLRSFLQFAKLEENPNNRSGPKVLSYHNEATIAFYVQGVVSMCLQSLGLFQSSSLYLEMSLFSSARYCRGQA